MSLFAMIAVLAVILFISDATKKMRKAEPNEQSKNIVGHTSAMEERPAIKQRKTEKTEKPMATPVAAAPQLHPVFLKEEDWSDYDQPSVLRKKNNAKASPKKETQAPAQKAQKKSPKQSMAEFQASKRPGTSAHTAKKGSYEEI